MRDLATGDVSVGHIDNVLCPLFDEIELLIPGDSPSIFLSLDKT